jgi:antitoxin component YwqK of YwqJK toxin-antitoxin module
MGVIHGKTTKYHPNGQVQIEGNYVNGLFDGRWIYYEDDGLIVGIAQFDKGSGKQKAWYRNGNLQREINYRDNLKHGKEIWYNTDGTVAKILHFEDGELVSSEEF